jgi:SAM-dependent methyltransferase
MNTKIFGGGYSIRLGHVDLGGVSRAAAPVRIDVGCGGWKEEGYIGLDTFDGPNVDFRIDLNVDKLPFQDNSVDHAVSYHALEHLPNFEHTVAEVWRALKPNAQFFVALPYFNTYINLANPFHVRQFNEHSFRFFSSEPECQALPERLWKFHFAPTWGLKGSANSSAQTEFRTCLIEFDYFPEFRSLPEAEKEALRLSRPNVVHQICFYLQAIKPPIPAINLRREDLIVPGKRKWMLDRNW